MPLILNQSSDSYRYSIDAFLLADFCKPQKGSKILDLGCGCGIISFLLAKKYSNFLITGIEIQSDLIALANKNLYCNEFISQISFIQGDIRNISKYFIQESFDSIVTNPPYYKIDTGRINPNPGKASARHELTAKLNDFIKAGSIVLKSKGSFYIIYTAKRMPELINNLMKYEIEPKIIRIIHARRNTEANLVLIKAIKSGKPGFKILSPLFIYNNDKIFSSDVEQMMKKWYSFK